MNHVSPHTTVHPSLNRTRPTTRAVSGGHDASRRDPSTFGRLVRRERNRVRALMLRLCRDGTLADDLTQETLLRAFRAFDRFEGRSRFSTWIYRIAYNVYLNHKTRSKVLHALPEDYEGMLAAPELPSGMRRCDMRKDVAWAVSGLDDRYRSVIVLYYFEDNSYPEIAEALDIPVGTVKTHLHRAKNLLRRRMAEPA